MLRTFGMMPPAAYKSIFLQSFCSLMEQPTPLAAAAAADALLGLRCLAWLESLG
jgi:hypothetical protein